jgi:predicted PurR-regulated permease PerM
MHTLIGLVGAIVSVLIVTLSFAIWRSYKRKKADEELRRQWEEDPLRYH